MEKTDVFFERSEDYPRGNVYYSDGCSPSLLEKLIDFFEKNADNIKSIFLGMYLYNNKFLHETLTKLSNNGVKINVISIPLEGYDSRSPTTILDRKTGKFAYKDKKTKQDLASELYNDIKRNHNKNLSVSIFPHMYLRSSNVRVFSRGDMPYSLHAKSILVNFKDGTSAIGLTSSNLAVRDLIKDEMLIIHETDDKTLISQSQLFFDTLLSNSFNILVFNDKKDWSSFSISTIKNNGTKKNIYIAPFFEDSPNFSEQILKEIINQAKERIYVCAQHICAFKYRIQEEFMTGNPSKNWIAKNGFLVDVLKKVKEGVKVSCLSQTFVDPDIKDHKCRQPSNKASFIEFIKAYKRNPNAKYAANKHVHLKFIIADDTLIVTTCNFTPTQFIYLKHVNIPSFFSRPELSYRGIHCEVGQYIIIESKKLCEACIKRFEEIRAKEETFRLEEHLSKVK